MNLPTAANILLVFSFVVMTIGVWVPNVKGADLGRLGLAFFLLSLILISKW